MSERLDDFLLIGAIPAELREGNNLPFPGLAFGEPLEIPNCGMIGLKERGTVETAGALDSFHGIYLCEKGGNFRFRLRLKVKTLPERL